MVIITMAAQHNIIATWVSVGKKPMSPVCAPIFLGKGVCSPYTSPLPQPEPVIVKGKGERMGRRGRRRGEEGMGRREGEGMGRRRRRRGDGVGGEEMGWEEERVWQEERGRREGGKGMEWRGGEGMGGGDG